MRRSPQGERGLKLVMLFTTKGFARRSPQGERGLKSGGHSRGPEVDGRSPQGERGLKYQRSACRLDVASGSLPARGAWIEISCRAPGRPGPRVAPRKGSVD